MDLTFERQKISGMTLRYVFWETLNVRVPSTRIEKSGTDHREEDKETVVFEMPFKRPREKC